MARRSKKPSPNRIAELRHAKGLTQQQLADMVDSHWVTISKLERGVMHLSDHWRQEISKALGIGEWDLYKSGKTLPIIHIDGYIQEGGELRALDDYTDEDFTLSTDMFTGPGYIWYVVSEDALWPHFQDGDRVCLKPAVKDEIKNYEGRICVAWYHDKAGQHQVVVGTLLFGSDDDLYTFNRVFAPPLKDIRPTHLAVVAMAVYWLGDPEGYPI